MTAIHDTINLASTVRPTSRLLGFVTGLKQAIETRSQRRNVRANLLGLSDRELFDMGITRGEIDYVAAHPSIDPRGN